MFFAYKIRHTNVYAYENLKVFYVYNNKLY